MKKVIVATTFRDFKGSSNDEIQHLFLESLKRQTHPNWELAVTIYTEKNVEPTISAKGLPAKFFKGQKGEFRFSHSEVLLNGLSLDKDEDTVILWTTCDVIFESNFFAKLISTDFDACTSHPHYMYSSVESFNQKRRPGLVLEEGIDTIAFQSKFLKTEKIKKDLMTYRFTDWGIFEHFLVALASVNNSKMVNLWGVSNISKIVNNRKITNDGRTYLKNSWDNNYKSFAQFLNLHKLNNDYLDLIYIHSRFSPALKFKYYRTFFPVLIKYWLRYRYERNNVINKIKRRYKRLAIWSQ